MNGLNVDFDCHGTGGGQAEVGRLRCDDRCTVRSCGDPAGLVDRGNGSVAAPPCDRFVVGVFRKNGCSELF